ncbi:unnamed protein product [Cyprideis torosa]|uniref:C2 domain-containing protein n=1 Tax=Cyprideis torosa TaxID=163714 RepID=A0A7R8WD23_9CRUS|nr:unnamed protein product [Cyprideis torosa]CAG0894176.1 unnamed protein product [Cyprideis torosa]
MTWFPSQTMTKAGHKFLEILSNFFKVLFKFFRWLFCCCGLCCRYKSINDLYAKTENDGFVRVNVYGSVSPSQSRRSSARSDKSQPDFLLKAVQPPGPSQVYLPDLEFTLPLFQPDPESIHPSPLHPVVTRPLRLTLPPIPTTSRFISPLEVIAESPPRRTKSEADVRTPGSNDTEIVTDEEGETDASRRSTSSAISEKRKFSSTMDRRLSRAKTASPSPDSLTHSDLYVRATTGSDSKSSSATAEEFTCRSRSPRPRRKEPEEDPSFGKINFSSSWFREDKRLVINIRDIQGLPVKGEDSKYDVTVVGFVVSSRLYHHSSASSGYQNYHHQTKTIKGNLNPTFCDNLEFNHIKLGDKIRLSVYEPPNMSTSRRGSLLLSLSYRSSQEMSLVVVRAKGLKLSALQQPGKLSPFECGFMN